MAMDEERLLTSVERKASRKRAERCARPARAGGYQCQCCPHTLRALSTLDAVTKERDQLMLDKDHLADRLNELENCHAGKQIVVSKAGTLCCEDCGRTYAAFPLDMTLPDEQWSAITGKADGSGVLCASCIVRRAALLPGAIAVRAVIECREVSDAG